MRRIVQIICLSLFLPVIALVVLQGYSSADQKPKLSDQDCEEQEARLISALNDSIQQRFKEIDETFGYSRIMRPDQTPHRFKPENAKEMKDVDELNWHGLKVVLYLAGRGVLGPMPVTSDAVLKRFIKGPGFITADQKAGGLPSSTLLWEESRKAMLSFQTGDVYNFTAGRWKFSARVVRASEQSCLRCHVSGVGSVFRIVTPDGEKNTLRIGDPLGVVLYGYEQTR